MGYSRFERTVGWLVGFPDITLNGKFKPLIHFAPKRLTLYIGRDGKSNAFGGLAKFWKV